MAVRKAGGHLGDVVIEQLRRNLSNGLPWRQPANASEALGYVDLIYLDSGHYYGGSVMSDFVKATDDLEMLKELWGEVREVFIEEHIKREPGTRPWAFYAIEDHPWRNRLTVACYCPPPTAHPGLPPANLSWFGRRRGCRCEFEDQSEYLERLGLLMPAEARAARATYQV